MSHARTQIRNALVTLLTGLATTGSRVFTSSVHALSGAELPALRLYVDEETITLQSIHNPALLQRDLVFRVECVTALNDGLDDDLDQMALEVEDAIASNPTLSGITNGTIVPTAIEVDRAGEGETKVGVLTISFLAQYEVENNAADVAI